MDTPTVADREWVGDSSLQRSDVEVIALDGAPEPYRLTSTALVHIELADVNDEAPKIEILIAQNGQDLLFGDLRGLQSHISPMATSQPQELVAYIEETPSADTVIAYVQVSDKDEDGEDVVRCFLGPRDNFTLQSEPLSQGQMEGRFKGSFDFGSVSGLRETGRKVTDYRILPKVPSGLQSSRAGADMQGFLDRETTPSQVITITCTDSAGNQADRKIRLHLLDINDNPPRFLNDGRFSFSVAENVQPIGGQHIWLGRVVAVDPDLGDNAKISYRLADELSNEKHPQRSDAHSLFFIKEDTGDMYAQMSLDRENAPENGIYTMTVLAVDHGRSTQLTGTAKVEVVVLDVNDWAPEFTRDIYTFTVPEDAPLREVIGVVEAIDRDATALSSSITYHMNAPKITRPYGSLEANSQVSKRSLNASVPSSSTTSTVTHANSTRRSESARLAANKTEDHEVLQRQPRQLGQGLSKREQQSRGGLSYAHQSGQPIFLPHLEPSKLAAQLPLSYFSVDSRTGEIRIIRKLDRETNAYFTFEVIATDSPPADSGTSNSAGSSISSAELMTPPADSARQRTAFMIAAGAASSEIFTATATVAITITDANDNAPEFRYPNTSILLHMAPDETLGHKILTVQAVDRDEGENARISYSIRSEIPIPPDGPGTGCFAIDEASGLIFLTRPIRGPVNHRLVVEACDHGAIPRCTSSPGIRITVSDDVKPGSPATRPRPHTRISGHPEGLSEVDRFGYEAYYQGGLDTALSVQQNDGQVTHRIEVIAACLVVVFGVLLFAAVVFVCLLKRRPHGGPNQGQEPFRCNIWRHRWPLFRRKAEKAAETGTPRNDQGVMGDTRLTDSQALRSPTAKGTTNTEPVTNTLDIHSDGEKKPLYYDQQLTILSYDAKFSTRDARPKDFIASFESALQKCEAGEECKNAMRQQVSTLLLQHKRQMTISKAEDRELLKIRKLEDIVTLPADKGRSTVVMDKAEYCAKLGNLLMDKEAYAPSTVSEFKKLVNSINKTIGKLRKAGALTRREALAAKASDAAMARFYGLPKVHKPGVPLRPIVSLRGTPTFGLSKWLYQRLCFLTKDSEWTVKSAEEFLSRIKRLEVEADEVMVSFDVISLFTSIPPALAIDTIEGFLREKYDETDQQLKRVHIIQLLELCLKTFFTFNGQVYEQKKGTPMGSPLSGLIAEAVLQRLERLVFSSYPPKFWARYVDDTFVIIKRSDVQTFKALLNSIFPDIQFTMEEELNNQLAFLDVQVTKLEDGKIRTTVYRKATNTRRILHFKSNHPVGHKRSCVRTLFQRVQTHCSDDNGRKEEIKYLHALFKANGYPKSFIRKCLKKPHPERSDGENPKFWLAIPYVKNVSEATARILKPFGIGVAHKPESTIRQQIMRPKDPLPVTEQSAVVYSIPCQNCDARYVGETGKRLGTRLHEHQLAINRKDKLSMVYGHVKQQNHNFAFEKARVIGRANDKMARLMLESWSSTGTLNRALDLHPAYQALRTRLESVRTRPSGQSSKVTRGRQPMPAESRREAGRGSCDQHDTPPHRDAHEAEINSHEPQQLISPLGDKGEADKHAGSPTITTVAEGSLVAGAHPRSIMERSALIGGERAGHMTVDLRCIHHPLSSPPPPPPPPPPPGRGVKTESRRLEAGDDAGGWQSEKPHLGGIDALPDTLVTAGVQHIPRRTDNQNRLMMIPSQCLPLSRPMRPVGNVPPGYAAGGTFVLSGGQQSIIFNGLSSGGGGQQMTASGGRIYGTLPVVSTILSGPGEMAACQMRPAFHPAVSHAVSKPTHALEIPNPPSPDYQSLDALANDNERLRSQLSRNQFFPSTVKPLLESPIKADYTGTSQQTPTFAKQSASYGCLIDSVESPPNHRMPTYPLQNYYEITALNNNMDAQSRQFPVARSPYHSIVSGSRRYQRSATLGRLGTMTEAVPAGRFTDGGCGDLHHQTAGDLTFMSTSRPYSRLQTTQPLGLESAPPDGMTFGHDKPTKYTYQAIREASFV
ncbi:hypothetical protein SprV_0200864900 [Sparganum proliferum]